jgi:hypothetical protein
MELAPTASERRRGAVAWSTTAELKLTGRNDNSTLGKSTVDFLSGTTFAQEVPVPPGTSQEP